MQLWFHLSIPYPRVVIAAFRLTSSQKYRQYPKLNLLTKICRIFPGCISVLLVPLLPFLLLLLCVLSAVSKAMTDHIPYDFFDFSDNPPLAALQIPFDWNSDELSLTFFLYFVGNDQVLTLSSDWNRYDSYSPNSSSSDSSTSSLSYDEYFSNFLQHPAATPLDFASISPLLLSNSLQLDNVPEIKSNAFVYHLPSYDQEDEMTYDSGVPLFKAPISFEHLIPGYAQTMSIDAITFELDQASHEIESEDESNEENLAEDDLIKFSIAYSTSADRVLDVSSMAAFGPVVLKREIVDQAGKSYVFLLTFFFYFHV